jgi:hypothetical protein
MDMSDQLVFIDTEFTCFSDPQLISIGLAASTGEEFYAEVPYAFGKCSEFVREVVVPLLSKETVYSYDELHMHLWNWFTVVKTTEVITICHDSEFDRTLFLQIFDNRPPHFIRFRDVSERNINELLRYEFHTKNGRAEHHALYDALALRYAFREWPLSK